MFYILHSKFQFIVDLSGFGPLTSSLQMKRTTAVLQAQFNYQIHKPTKKIFSLSIYFMKIPFYEDNKSTKVFAAFTS